jgi:hypothetical protein
MQKFKRQLALVFDDNLRTKQWQNIADWVIIGLIIVSTVEVFLSTFDPIAERYGTTARQPIFQHFQSKKCVTPPSRPDLPPRFRTLPAHTYATTPCMNAFIA